MSPERLLQPTRSAHIKLALLLMVVALSLGAAGIALVTALNAQQTRADRQADGRRFAVRATCLIQKAIIDAGIDALSSGVLLPGDRLVDGVFVPGQLTKRLGPTYPTYTQRIDRAKQAAQAYEDRIAKAVEDAADGRARPALTHHHLDCSKLARAGRAT
jgi:hypothetical protein